MTGDAGGGYSTFGENMYTLIVPQPSTSPRLRGRGCPCGSRVGTGIPMTGCLSPLFHGQDTQSESILGSYPRLPGPVFIFSLSFFCVCVCVVSGLLYLAGCVARSCAAWVRQV